jgi:hypothetical protein
MTANSGSSDLQCFAFLFCRHPLFIRNPMEGAMPIFIFFIFFSKSRKGNEKNERGRHY